MNRTLSYALMAGLASLSLVVGAAEQTAATNTLNRFTLTPRAAFNISSRFSSGGMITLGPAARHTPGGDAYNYDNGYVLRDASGNAGGQTWYWGYDRQEQIVNNTIEFNRSSVGVNGADSELGSGSEPAYGAELAFSRQLGMGREVHYGFEAAVNYLNLNLNGSVSATGDLRQVTDAYAFTPGTTPPMAPYRGSFGGPGFLIGTTPSSSVVVVAQGGAQITGSRKLSADVYGMRVGPYVEFPVFDALQLRLSGGFAGAWLNASAAWGDRVSLSGGRVLAGLARTITRVCFGEAILAGSWPIPFQSGGTSRLVWNTRTWAPTSTP
jgi:hypothetical protein